MRQRFSDRGQASVEYLILVAIGVLIAVLAAAGLFHMEKIVYDEYNRIKNYQNSVIEVLLS